MDLAVGNYPLAEREYGKSAAACGGAGDRECVAGAAVGLGFALTAQDKFTEAVSAYQRAIDAFTGLKWAEHAARAEIGLAQAFTGLARYDDALAAASRARMAATGHAFEDVLWRALVAEARVHRRMGNPDRALGAARAAIYPVDQMREDARTSPGSPLPRDTSTAFETLAVLQAESGDAGAAFETSERMRVHDLRAALAGNEREITRGMTPDEREEDRAAAAAIISLRAQATRERGLPKPDATRLAALEHSLEQAITARSAQQDRLFARLPDLRLWRGLVEPARASDLSTVLDADTVLIDLVVDDDALLVMAARLEEGEVRIEARVSPITRRDLAAQVATMLQPAALADATLLAKNTAPLVTAFPEGVLTRAVSARRVLIVPHGMVWRVPFEALPAGASPLGATAALTYLPSVSARVRAPALAGDPPAGLLAVAAPAVAPEVIAFLAQTAPDWQIRSADAATREADAALGADPADKPVLLAGDQATRSAFRDQAPRAGVLHIAAPFRINPASVLFSPVLLTGDRASTGPRRVGAPADTMMDLREVMGLDLHARVAVLSDDAALSMRDGAAETPLLQWGWRAAGVPTLIVSRWPVDDEPRSVFVRELHQQLRMGTNADAAVGAAAAAVRKTTRWSAPLYWSGWIAVGDR